MSAKCSWPWATTVHEDSAFALERLCQLSRLSQFCQLKDMDSAPVVVRMCAQNTA